MNLAALPVLAAEPFGIALSLDIGGLIGLIGAAAAALGVVEWYRKRRNRDVEEERARQEAAAEAERNRQESAAAAERKRQEAAAEADLKRQQKYQEHAEALAIHESLTSLEVFEARRAARVTPPDEAARDFLVALHERSSSRYAAYQTLIADEADESRDGLDALIHEALGAISESAPEALGESQAAADEKRDQRDRTRYWVAEQGPLTKWHTINVLAQRFCRERGITTVRDFEKQFGDVVVAAAGSEIGGVGYDPSRLLYLPGSGTEHEQARYGERDRKTAEKIGLLTLDGQGYLVHWDMGFRRTVKAIGTRVHLPLIDALSSLEPSGTVRVVE